MDTPITVSSTSTLPPNKSDFLQLNYSSGKHNDSIISIDSTSYERVPVSWDKKKIAFSRTESNTSLTNIQKVSNWIKSIEGEEPKSDSVVVDLRNDIEDCNKTFSESIAVMDSTNKDTVPDSKSVILFRCDFNKSVTAKTYYPPLNPFNRATPLINCFKNEEDTKITSTGVKISNNMDHTPKKVSLKNTSKKVAQKHLLLKRPDSSKLINYPSQINNKFSIENESCCLKLNDEKSDGSSDVYEVPLSPESRKKELCSYLQLMNPADKKESFILQNRRSTRVRNLAAMQEKKKWSVKLNAQKKTM
ncbi:hypothetical protein NQ314_005320 [Rhamnusium bicolor]|uniref:Uncharacterized protein n=1 Tax=Rhamnusium bicolor TaxID=1586634 RepID=A0AAV8ZHD5_9CUCU|nr:hypothetical protein NQ314_005320 [Rhamnusium bicolor]